MEINHSIFSDAIDRIAALARKPLEEDQKIETSNFFGRPYYKRNGTPVPVQPPEINLPGVRFLGSLDALVALIQQEGVELTFPSDHWELSEDGGHAKLFVVIKDERTVICSTTSAVMPDYASAILYQSHCDIVSSFSPGREYDHETFMIALRSQFRPSEDRDYLLEMLASVSSQATVKSEDNGLGQQVSVNKGICNVQMQPIKSIVRLRPYRTFQEVEQPESEFLVRLSVDSEGGVRVALHEADGGMWRLDARRNIALYLAQALENEIDAGQVVVTA